MNLSKISNQSMLGKLTRLPLNLIPKHAVVPVLQGPLRGKKWVVGSSSHGCWLGSYEHEKQYQFIKEVKKGDVVYDIGAHVGFYTLLSSVLVGERGTVLAFEPFPPNMAYLQRHVGMNSLRNVSLFQKAVADHNDQIEFEVHTSSSMGHLSYEKTASTISVEAISLDKFVEEQKLPWPNIVKVDIEGAEYRFLLGARQLLTNRPVKLFLATHGTEVHKQCLNFLQALGYTIKNLEDKPLELSREILALVV